MEVVMETLGMEKKPSLHHDGTHHVSIIVEMCVR